MYKLCETNYRLGTWYECTHASHMIAFNIFLHFATLWPLAFQPQSYTTCTISQCHAPIPCLNFEHFEIIRFLSYAADIIMDALQITSEKYNVRINTKKTKVMRISQVEGRPIRIKLNGQNLEKVKQFCYLGSLVTENGRSCEVRRRIALGKDAFAKPKEIQGAAICRQGYGLCFWDTRGVVLVDFVPPRVRHTVYYCTAVRRKRPGLLTMQHPTGPVGQ